MKYTTYDLVVVGTGFASTFFLKKYLSKASRTAKVLVLERGHLYPHTERLKEARGESTPYAGLNIPFEEAFINRTPDKHWIFQPAFGGSSNCWYGCTPRFMPQDFRLQSLYGVGQDWPLQYYELDDYYTEVEEAMSISGPADTPFPRKKPYPQPPHQFSTVDELLKKQWGSLYINQPTARARKAVGKRAPCCATAVCSLCPVNAKFTIENSAQSVYQDSRVEVRMGAQVRNLELEGNLARQVVFVQEGKEQRVAGELIALGANALFNAHILLNSGDSNPYTGRGLGEQYGLQALVYLDGLENTGGSTWVNANGYMLYDGPHRSQHAACLIESNNAPFFRLERGRWRQMASFRMIFEDLPGEDNRVETTDDPFKPAVTFTGPSDYTLRAVEAMKQKMPELLACLPVETIEYQEPFATEAHILGTTRMSSSPASGVLDKHLLHHQYRNLFVLGSGSFTTFTPANPTLTLSALSLHAADSIFLSS